MMEYKTDFCFVFHRQQTSRTAARQSSRLMLIF